MSIHTKKYLTVLVALLMGLNPHTLNAQLIYPEKQKLSLTCFQQQVMPASSREFVLSILPNWSQRRLESVELFKLNAKRKLGYGFFIFSLGLLVLGNNFHKAEFSNSAAKQHTSKPQIADLTKAIPPPPVPSFPLSISEKWIKSQSIPIDEATALRISLIKIISRFHSELKGTNQELDFKFFVSYFNSPVALLRKPESEKSVGYVYYLAGPDGFKRKLILNYSTLNPIVEKINQGDGDLRITLRNAFVRLGAIFRTENGTNLASTINAAAMKLDPNQEKSTLAIRAMQNILSTHGIALMVPVGELHAFAGLMPQWRNNFQGGADFEVIPFIESQIYINLSNLTASGPHSDIYERLLWLVLAKEGGGLDDILSNLKKYLELHNLSATFDAKSLSDSSGEYIRSIQKVPERIESAKTIIAMQSALESAGFEAAVDLAKVLGLTAGDLQQAANNTSDPDLRNLANRFRLILQLVEGKSNTDSRLILRNEGFNEASKYLRGFISLIGNDTDKEYLMNPKYSKENLIPKNRTSNFPFWFYIVGGILSATAVVLILAARQHRQITVPALRTAHRKKGPHRERPGTKSNPRNASLGLLFLLLLPTNGKGEGSPLLLTAA